MTEKTIEKIHAVADVTNETREKSKKIAKEIAYSSIAVVTGGLVGGVIGATISKAGGYTKAANTIGYAAGLVTTYATSYTLYEQLKTSDEIRQKQLELFRETDVEDEILDDEEEGGENEEA